VAKTLASRATKPRTARPVEARHPMAGWQRSDQQPGSRLEPDPVVADAFRFAPVLVAGDVWPLFAAENPARTRGSLTMPESPLI
jgi:hypothetical protein